MNKEYDAIKALSGFYVKWADYQSHNDKVKFIQHLLKATESEEWRELPLPYRKIMLNLICEMAHAQNIINERTRFLLEEISTMLYPSFLAQDRPM